MVSWYLDSPCRAALNSLPEVMCASSVSCNAAAELSKACLLVSLLSHRKLYFSISISMRCGKLEGWGSKLPGWSYKRSCIAAYNDPGRRPVMEQAIRRSCTSQRSGYRLVDLHITPNKTQ